MLLEQISTLRFAYYMSPTSECNVIVNDVWLFHDRRVFNSHPAFRLASDGCLRSLATNFKMTHCAPGDFIIRKGESITDLIFVVSGSLEVVQDGEILAFLGNNDVCGDSHWKETRLGKSVVHVRALTYCDIHTINVDDLIKVLEFHKPFAITFSRNLCLTFDLSKRVVFSKVKKWIYNSGQRQSI